MIAKSKALLLAGAFIALFWPVFQGLELDWRLPTYSHGYLIPLLAGYALWQRRAIWQQPMQPSYWGWPLLLAALLLLVLGVGIGEAFMQRVALVLTLLGLTLTLAGSAYLKKLAFPIGMLFLAIPLPYVIHKWLAYHLRFWDAQVAFDAVQALGVVAYLDSPFIIIPGMVLEVADDCSGIFSIISLTALAAIYAQMGPDDRPAWKKWAIFLAAIPISIAANVLRIILVVALAYYWGPQALDMDFHTTQAIFNFLIGVAMLAGFAHLLDRIRRRRHVA